MCRLERIFRLQPLPLSASASGVSGLCPRAASQHPRAALAHWARGLCSPALWWGWRQLQHGKVGPMKAPAAAGEPGGGGTRPYSHFHFTWPQRLEMEENSERSKAATQTEGVIIIITMIIVIKIIMLAWKVLYKAGLFMSACCLCLRHFIFAHNN